MPVCRGVCRGFKVQSQIAGKCAATPGAERSGALVLSVAWVGARCDETRFRVSLSWCALVPSGGA